MKALAVSTSYTAVIGYENANSPLIGYDNQCTLTNLAATDSSADYPVTNLVNVSTIPSQRWQAASAGVKYLTCTLSRAVAVDYVGIVGHNFGTGLIAVSVEGDLGDGAGFSEIVPVQYFPDNRPVILKFAKDAYNTVRVKLGNSANSTVPRCSVMYVGSLLLLPRNLYVGHTPITLNVSPNVSNGMTENAHFSGRLVTGSRSSTEVPLSNLPPGWYRSKFQPFVLAAHTTPFFFSWRPHGYPREVGFCWLTGPVVPKNARANGMMSTSMSLGGIIK